MNIKVEKLPKATLKINVVVENEKVKAAYDQAVDEAIKKTEIVGFRKGNAPREMVVDKVGISTLHGDAINLLLQSTYPQVLKEKLISPVSNPKVEVKEFDLEKDFEFTATVAIRPEVKIKDYKKALKKRLEEKPKSEEPAHLGTNDVIDVLVKESDFEISDMLTEEESDRMLYRLINQLQAINMTLEQYLKAQNKGADVLRKEYKKTAETNLKAEFVLSHLVTEEKIEVTDKEIDEMFNALGNQGMKERAKDPYERMYVKTILQKNKLISKLIEETEGKKDEQK